MDVIDLGRNRLPESTALGAVVATDRSPRRVSLELERGRIEIQPAGPGVFRVRMTGADAFRPRRPWTVVAPRLDALGPDLAVDEEADAVVVSAGPLIAEIRRTDGAVAFRQGGVTFAADISAATVAQVELADTQILARAGDELPDGPARDQIQLRKRMDADENYYGFGQRTGDLDRRGRRFTNWNIDDPSLAHTRVSDNLYQSHPMFMAVRTGLAWGLFVDTTFYSHFDTGASSPDELVITALGGELDYYLLAGPTPADVIDQLTRITGRPTRPPRWALGFHQSRWGYKSEDDMRALADRFDRRAIPLDAIHFDIDYMRGYRNFTWDPDRFPDPARLVGELAERGIHTVTIVDPGVRHEVGRGYRPAEEGLARRVFLERADGSPFSGYCWPDSALFPDFCREDVRAWWGRQHADNHVDHGVAGIWNDMNEPSLFDRPFSEGLSDYAPLPLAIEHGPEDHRTDHAEVHNLYGLLMSRATYEGLRELRPESRPWVLTRSAFTGIQRYAATWMGDNRSWWEHLEMSVPQLTSMGLCGVPHVGVDIGGFAEHCGPELLARWLELGAFYPFMRIHTAAGTRAQEPWSHDTLVETIARGMIQLRTRLIPYLDTLAHEALSTGAPLFRPMVFDYPDEVELRTVSDQALLGPSILVAPILRPQRDHRMVSFPPGRWYRLDAGTVASDAPTVSHKVVHAPLGRPAVFARGIVPLANPRNRSTEPMTELELAVFPDGDQEITLVDDDGHSMGFERGELSTTRIQCREISSGGVEVEISAREGGYQPPPRDFMVVVRMPEQPAAAELDGRGVPCHWDAARSAAVIDFADDGEPHHLTLR